MGDLTTPLSSVASTPTSSFTTETSSLPTTPTSTLSMSTVESSTTASATSTLILATTTPAPSTLVTATTTMTTTEASLHYTLINQTQTIVSEAERMEYLRHLDAEKWPYIYPVIIYLLLLMVIGMIGNSLVIIVYYKKFKPNTTRLFILTLAIYDLLTCTLSVPGVVVEMRFHYTFFFPGLCKVFRFSRMYFVLMSLFTLMIVAVDRFRKVCRPLKPQYTIRSASFSILAVNIVAVCYTILGAVVGGNQTVTTDREDVFGSNCSYDDEFFGKPITKFYSAVGFVVFVVCVVILAVLYSLIGRQIWKHQRFNFKPTKPENSSTDSQNLTTATELNEIDANNHKLVEMTSSYSSSVAGSTKEDTSSASGNRNSCAASIKRDARTKSKKIKPTGGEKRKSTNRTTFTLFIITLVFIISFLPFLIMVALWGSKWDYVNNLHGYTFTVFKLFFHSYHINNVVNCYVYGFCNPRFRSELKQFISCGKTKR